MRLKRFIKVASLSIVSVLCALVLLLVVDIAVFSGSGNTEFLLTPKEWRFSIGKPWTMTGADGSNYGTMMESHVGPIVIRNYESPSAKDTDPQ